MSKPIQSKALRDEMCRLVRAAAEPAQAGELVRSAIRRAALVLGFEYSRVKRYWYGEIEVPPAHEVDTAREKVASRQAMRSSSSAALAAPALTVSREPTPRYRSSIHVVYDEDGRVWSTRSAEFREALGVGAPDFDLAEFAVRNFGWIEVKAESNELQIKFSPRMAQARALDAVYELLASSLATAIVLVVRVGRDWTNEVVDSRQDAAARLQELVSNADMSGAQRFIASRQPLSVLFQGAQSALLDMLNRKRQLLTQEEPDACALFAGTDPNGMTSVVERAAEKRSASSWVWRHVGRGIRFYTAEERSKMVGLDFLRIADRDYAEWCTRAYDRAAASGEPLIEDIRAVVFVRNGRPLESRYRRLLMPLHGAGGRDIVLVASELRPH